MEARHGQDVVALPPTAWLPSIKRRASPLDADIRAPKKKLADSGRYTDPAVAARVWVVPAVNEQPGLRLPVGHNLTAQDHRVLYGRSFPPSGNLEAPGNCPRQQPSGPGSEHVSDSFLRGQLVTYRSPEVAYEISSQLPATDPRILTANLPLSPDIATSPLASLQRVAPNSYYQTHPYTPSFYGLRGMGGSLHWPQDMLVPPDDDPDAPSRLRTPYHGPGHTQVSTSDDAQWLSTNSPSDCILRDLPSIPQVHGSTNSPGLMPSVNSFSSFSPFYNNFPTSSVPPYPSSTAASHGPYPGCPETDMSGKLPFTAAPHPPEEHSSPARHPAQQFEAAGGQQYHQHFPYSGHYVGVVHPSGTCWISQDASAELSDVDETMVAGYEVGAEPGRSDDLASRANCPKTADLYSSSSRNSSWVHISRTNSATEMPEHMSLITLATDDDPEYQEQRPKTKQSRQPRRPRQPRRQFADHMRIATNETRKKKACIRCRQQRNRCIENKRDPLGPCADCMKILSKTSGKIVHNAPCIRVYTMPNLVLFRSGGLLGLTRRWEGTKVCDVGDWADDRILIIKLAQGICSKPIELRVRKFKPVAGDVLHRKWYDSDSCKWKETPLEPYCLADVEETAKYFSIYLKDTAFEGLKEALQGSCKLVRETYVMAFRHAASLPTDSKEKELLFKIIRFIYAIRHMTGSAWIEGEELLGMQPPTDKNYPLCDPKDPSKKRVSLPRLIVAQFDSIQNQRINPTKNVKAMLGELESCLRALNPHIWFTMYLVIFMLLHEISFACKDRRRWAHDNKTKTRYGEGPKGSLGMFVEQLQSSANNLLTHWEYFKCVDFQDPDWATCNKPALRNLATPQLEFLKKSLLMMQSYEPGIPQTPEDGCWEHELYFVSQMFKPFVVPLKTYNYVAP